MVEGSFDKKIKKRINLLFKELWKKHGSPSISGQWRIWCKRPKTKNEKERIIIESILTQRANWKNVELAVSNLKKANLLDLKRLAQEKIEKIENLIKPSGFYRQKAKRLKDLAKLFTEEFGGIEGAERIKTEVLREKLLSVKGVGKETADDILLYAFEREVFVIDEYTKRFVQQHNLFRNLSYDFLQKQFEKILKRDYKIYQDVHALIIMEMKGKKC